MRHTIGEFIKQRGLTAYRFWKDTGLSRPTAYRVCSDPYYPVAGDVLEKICDTYSIQPGEILIWEKPAEKTAITDGLQHLQQLAKKENKPRKATSKRKKGVDK
jgi:DNA-binding Xre family transcriptional regulator